MEKLNDVHVDMLTKRHYYWLDVLRALAMLAVLGGHYRNVLLPSYCDIADSSGVGIKMLYALTKWGHSAVIVFFVLSGFLVVGGFTIWAT